MKAKLLTKVLLALTLLGLMVFAVSCGPGAADDPTPDEPAEVVATPTPAPVAEIEIADPLAEIRAAIDLSGPWEAVPAGINRDGVLIFGGSGWDGQLNSIMSNNLYDAYVWNLIQEGLISNDHAGNPIPHLAHWIISDDYLTYTFFLDPRVAFSDGRPLTAYDVEFTFTTIAHPFYDGPRTSAVEDLVGFQEFRDGNADRVEGIRVIDEHTIEFTHVVYSPQHIWNFGFGILCREFYAFNTWDDFMARIATPFGSGPFVFGEFLYQQWIDLPRNDNYWHPDRQPNLAGILMRWVPSESLVPELITGGIHVAMPPANMDNLTAIQDADNLWYNLFVANTLRHITFNTTRPHLSDHRVRQALAYAFDTRAYIIADTGHPDLRTVGIAPFSPVSWAFPAGGEGLNLYEFNMERAHELMDEAGWEMGPSGFRYNAAGDRFVVNWLIYPEAAWPGIVTGLAFDTWGELGVELDIEMMDFTSVIARAADPVPGTGDWDIYQMGWSMAIDPDLRGGLWDATMTSEGDFFASGWDDQRLIDLIHQGATTMAIEDRIPIYHEISRLTNYYLPIWVLSNGTQLWTFCNSVNNMDVGPFFNWTGAVVNTGTWLD